MAEDVYRGRAGPPLALEFMSQTGQTGEDLPHDRLGETTDARNQPQPNGGPTRVTTDARRTATTNSFVDGTHIFQDTWALRMRHLAIGFTSVVNQFVVVEVRHNGNAWVFKIQGILSETRSIGVGRRCNDRRRSREQEVNHSFKDEAVAVVPKAAVAKQNLAR